MSRGHTWLQARSALVRSFDFSCVDFRPTYSFSSGVLLLEKCSVTFVFLLKSAHDWFFDDKRSRSGDTILLTEFYAWVSVFSVFNPDLTLCNLGRCPRKLSHLKVCL
ncbi:uncharacterized protein ARMOST_00984 [Armillaria ostoyae]|uniref:Uncharacterized protein n=1 Tax=Armillaria ostoyae TaxID=47428 RepID=A0A284QMQ0_ARMOS|nr:uncharacterized protein ARMOST_00984 [Armillaria ostoyae]